MGLLLQSFAHLKLSREIPDRPRKMTRQAFCEKHRVGRSTLGYYLRHYKNRPAGLARVEVTPPTPAGGFTLVLANGRRIECGATDLPELIRIAEVA